MKKSVLICVMLLLGLRGLAQNAYLEPKHEHRLNVVSLTVYGLAPIAVYERIIPFGDNFGIIGSVGGFYYGKDYLGYSLGATIYAGTPKHKAEFGGVYLNEVLSIAYGAYRFTGNSGLFAKGGLGYAFMPGDDFESGVVPILAIGFAF